MVTIAIIDRDRNYVDMLTKYVEDYCSSEALMLNVPMDMAMNKLGTSYDVYLVDMVCYNSLKDKLPKDKTIVLMRDGYEANLGAQCISKYQKMSDIIHGAINVANAYKMNYSNSQTSRTSQKSVRSQAEKSAEDYILDPEDEKYVLHIKEELQNDALLPSRSNDELKAIINQKVDSYIGKVKQSMPSKKREIIAQYVYNSIRGYGVLDILLGDETITEIMVNGYDSIFIERNGETARFKGKFESPEQLEDLIQKIVGKAGREVNQSSPIVDTRLADGSRVNVVLPPIALSGATMTIRKFSKEPITIQRLIELGAITQEAADFLKMLVRARYNIFISGGTGSGKTTFLNALSNFIPKSERIITIEDSAELKINGIENLVSMETRNANASGVGEVSMTDLIRSSLRMRPDRIIVGEVRGKEAVDMLQAMNTGHDGSLSTGHANSSEDMLSRLETMILQNSDSIPESALRRQISSSLDIIVHLSRMMDHSRKVVEISEIRGIDGNNNIVVAPLFKYSDGGLRKTGDKLENTYKLEMAHVTD